MSMPFFYDNSVGYSEATMTLSYPRDWTEEGVGVLSLWFYGDPNNAPEPMYVALNGSAVDGEKWGQTTKGSDLDPSTFRLRSGLASFAQDKPFDPSAYPSLCRKPGGFCEILCA